MPESKTLKDVLRVARTENPPLPGEYPISELVKAHRVPSPCGEPGLPRYDGNRPKFYTLVREEPEGAAAAAQESTTH